MTFKERWSEAKSSEVTIIGRLFSIIIVITIILAPSQNAWVTDGIPSVIIGVGLFWFLAALAIAAFALVGTFLIMIIGWILSGEFYVYLPIISLEEVLDVILTVYKIVFGDYEHKYDFLRGEGEEN